MSNEQVAVIDEVADVIINKMFRVAKGETIAITTDPGSHMNIVSAMTSVVTDLGGIPMVIQVPLAKGDADAGIDDWPSDALSAALCTVDVWIEMNSVTMLYSRIWEEAMSRNKKLRYLVLGASTLQSLHRVFTGYDVPTLGRFLSATMSLVEKANLIRITSENGTDVSYHTDPSYAFDIDDGDYSRPIFGTAPGYVNIVPKQGSMNGRIVFDELMNADVFGSDGQVAFIMKDGGIEKVEGNTEAAKFEEYLADFNDPNMYKISHNMIGLNPSVRELSGEIVEDERIWGGVDFGFGHTSPIDMPPDGQMAKSHFDGVVGKATMYLDGVKILDNGVVCHPDLIELSEELIGKGD